MNRRNLRQYEFECDCGHIWIDDHNLGCPMCQNHNDIIRRDYNSLPPETFNRKYKNH